MFNVPRPKQHHSTTPTGTRPKTNVGLSYMQRTSEALIRVFKAHGVGTYHRPINTIRSILVHPKDKTHDAQKCGLSCQASYQDERPSQPQESTNSCGRTLCARTPQTMDSVNGLAREDIWLKRKVRESIEIKIGQPAMNRD